MIDGTFLAVNSPRYAVALVSSSVSSTVRTGWPEFSKIARDSHHETIN